jgi:hypothetical protein
MTFMLEMMQDIHNKMISFKHRHTTNPKSITTPSLRLLTKRGSSKAKEDSLHSWCNFCDEALDPTTYEPFFLSKIMPKGRKPLL